MFTKNGGGDHKRRLSRVHYICTMHCVQCTLETQCTAHHVIKHNNNCHSEYIGNFHAAEYTLMCWVVHRYLVMGSGRVVWRILRPDYYGLYESLFKCIPSYDLLLHNWEIVHHILKIGNGYSYSHGDKMLSHCWDTRLLWLFCAVA